MLTVEIDVPIMGKRYDFRIDENVPLYEIKTELAEMICQKEQCILEGEAGGLTLWDARRALQLTEKDTAAGNGLRTGSRILLI